jgi:hypothetical protein
MLSRKSLGELLELVIKFINNITLKQVLAFLFIFLIRLFCKNFLFSGINNIIITITIMCFISMLVLSLNHNKFNNLNYYILNLIYLPIIITIFIIFDFENTLLNIFFYIFTGIPIVFVLGIDNNIIPVIPPGSNNPGGMPDPSGNQNNSLGLANNEDTNSRNRRSLANFTYTNPNQLIFEHSSRQEKYDKVNYAHQLVEDAWYMGTKREVYAKFSEACDKLARRPRSLTYMDLGVLKKGFVDHNHLLRLESKQLLHGLAQEGQLELSRSRNSPGLRITNLEGPDARVIVQDANIIKREMLNKIIQEERN